jgi:NAD(P)-dependent dehydrogenase (short-subunit alcohol dehydrogenase family)
MGLQGKNALVTGATSGIGRATAEALAEGGASVVVSGRDSSRGAEVVEAIERLGGQASFVPCDLNSSEDIQRLVDSAEPVDVLVNNGGVFPFAATHETGEQLFDETFAVNVRAPFMLTGALAPKMAARSGGAIVNVTTMAAEFGLPGAALYGASKAALGLLTKAWAAEYSSQGVRVNAISPGPTRTPGTEPMGEAIDQLAQNLPLDRPASATEIAAAAVFLASDQASFINGAVVPVDGGRTAV